MKNILCSNCKNINTKILERLRVTKKTKQNKNKAITKNTSKKRKIEKEIEIQQKKILLILDEISSKIKVKSRKLFKIKQTYDLKRKLRHTQYKGDMKTTHQTKSTKRKYDMRKKSKDH